MTREPPLRTSRQGRLLLGVVAVGSNLNPEWHLHAARDARRRLVEFAACESLQ